MHRHVQRLIGLLTLALAIPAWGQTPLHKRIEVKYDNLPVAEVLKDLSDKAGVRFTYADKLLETADSVTYEARDQEVGRVATRILLPRGLRLENAGANVVSVVKRDPFDEFKVRREEVYEFTEKPKVTREGDKATIEFESKAFCDVTVAVEDASGKIIRHLASGVLGENAPEPFQWNSKKQVVVWDGKNDKGEYVDDKDSITVRVSLGLKPQFERTLFWDPRKRSSNGWGSANAPLMRATPEGVYVYETGAMDHVRLFDHDGNYVRTIYPFPSDKLDKVAGLQKHRFPQDGKTLPLKASFQQSTLLFGKNASPAPTRGESGFKATSMAVVSGRIALAGKYVSRLAADGTTGGLPLAGPKVVCFAQMHGVNASFGHDSSVTPCGLALSPDGKWLYLTGYMWRYTWHNDSYHGVLRVPFEEDAPPTLFAGSMKQDDAGTENGRFRGATGVACDAQGRVYVADHINDRVQVFAPDGKFLKAIPVFRPAMISIHPKTGEIYVFSWMTPNRFNLKIAEERQKAHQPPITIQPKLVKLGTFDNPKESASYPLPLPAFTGYMEWWNLPPIQTVGDVDFWSEPPTIWISQATDASFRGEWDKLGMLLLREKDGKLEVFRDFGKEAVKSVVRATPPILDRQRLYVNPKTGRLYVGEGDSGVAKSFKELVEIDPNTGKVKVVPIRYAAEDIAFDSDGLVYLRSDNSVVRYDPGTWREVPWDYGEERDNVAFDGGSPNIVAALITPGHRSPSFWHMGGLYVSPQGHVAVACPNTAEPGKRIPGHVFGPEQKSEAVAPAGRHYTPALYPGRPRWGEIHIWDKHSKPVYEDAFPGVGHMNGIGIDRQDNVYTMANGHRIIDGKKYDPDLADDLSETLIKVRPKGARLLGSAAPVPLTREGQPKRSADFQGFPTGASWVEGAEWFYGGVGYTGNAPWDAGGCRCWNARFCLDYFARSFAPEPRHFSVAVLDSNGNLILRVGRYGNVDDGKPLAPAGGPPSPRSIGGDEVGLFHACYAGTHTDQRLFIADAGNARIVSVRLDYHATERVALKDVADEKR